MNDAKNILLFQNIAALMSFSLFGPRSVLTEQTIKRILQPGVYYRVFYVRVTLGNTPSKYPKSIL